MPLVTLDLQALRVQLVLVVKTQLFQVLLVLLDQQDLRVLQGSQVLLDRQVPTLLFLGQLDLLVLKEKRVRQALLAQLAQQALLARKVLTLSSLDPQAQLVLQVQEAKTPQFQVLQVQRAQRVQILM